MLKAVSFDSSSGGSGDVSGPGSTTDNALVRWDGTSGTTVQNSSATLDDLGNLSTTSFNGVLLTTGGSATKYLSEAGTYTTPAGGGTGDVVGPASSTDNAIVRFDSTTGKLIQNSVVTIADTTGVISGSQGLVLSGSTSGTLTIISAATAGTNTITFPAGTTDFSATGGTGQFVKQNSAGSAFTVAAVAVGEVSGLGTGVATFLATPSSANLISAVTDETGSGALVFANTPTLVTPVLGVASATTINKVTLTAPASGSTLTIADGKTAIISNTLTFTGTDSSSVAFGTGGTVAYVANKLSVFAATTSAELAGVISDEYKTGSNDLLLFANVPSNDSTATGASFGIGTSALSGQSGSSAAYNNTAIGYQTLTGTLTTAAVQNTAVGFQALKILTTGSLNTAIGYQALVAATTTIQNVAIGAFAGNAISVSGSGSNSVYIGYAAAKATAGQGDSVYIGAFVGGLITTAQTAARNVFIGSSTVGSQTAIGERNVGIGYQVMNNSGTSTATDDNVYVGYLAGLSHTTAAGNVGIGSTALEFVTTGANNTAVGFQAALGITGTKLTGSGNVAVGKDAGLLLQGAAATNTIVGTSAGASVTSGASNTIIGSSVGSTTLTTGSNNILIGVSSAVTTAGASDSNTFKLGGTGTAIFSATATDGTPIMTIGSRTNMDKALSEKVITIADGAGAVIDASLGNVFTWTGAADRTAGTTTNPTAGQKMILIFIASGAIRTLTLPTATTGDFAFGSDITTLTATASGKADVIGCVYGTVVANRWAVVAYSKGY